MSEEIFITSQVFLYSALIIITLFLNFKTIL